MFRPNRPSSGVQVVVVKESVAHCKAVLFLLTGCLGLVLVMWVNDCFNFGVLELHMFALFVMWDVLCCRSQWPPGLRQELSSLSRTVGSWVGIPL
jgi:hypothetical protein